MTDQQEHWVHDCPGCKSFPECPCGDGNCPLQCVMVRRLMEAAAPIREAVTQFDGERFSRELFDGLGIDQEKKAEE